ncbi:MAG: hypothetical protein U5L95_03075 [Candidatus Saccharibacteria bacterium]|nr:hypothetical protein [Candidatus Saccharibacteria bacterium]
MQRNAPKIFVLIGLVFFIVAGGLLFRQHFNDPENVFYDMLRGNVTTSGVSRSVTQEGPGQSLIQKSQLQTGETNIVAGRTDLRQGNEQSETTIVTERTGTPAQDYVRYAAISTDEVTQSGEEFDFSNVVGQWGLSPASGEMTRGGELFGEATLGIVPFGKLDRWQTEKLIEEIKERNVYGVDFSAVERALVDGRPTYRYRAQIQSDRYVRMLQLFGGYIGTSQLSDLNPEEFANNPPIAIDFEVDVWSRQLVTASFVNSERVEDYTAYGAWREVKLPEDTVPISELQQRLQQVQ